MIGQATKAVPLPLLIWGLCSVPARVAAVQHLGVPDTINTLLSLVAHALERQGHAHYSVLACCARQRQKSSNIGRFGVLQSPLVGPGVNVKRARKTSKVEATKPDLSLTARQPFDTTPTLEVSFVAGKVGHCNAAAFAVRSPESDLAAFLPLQEDIVSPSHISVAGSFEAKAAKRCITLYVTMVWL